MINFSKFWGTTNLINLALIPLSYIYNFIYLIYRISKKEKKLNIPVICIGNLTLGGAGKTPVTIKLRQMISKKFENIFVLTRGYGGKLRGPKIVTKNSKYIEVGDESLIHCLYGKTCVSKNKISGAELCVLSKAEIILMDDGLQSIDIKRNLRIVVIDGQYEFGNNLLFPAGPLRQSIFSSYFSTDIAIVIGDFREEFIKSLRYKNIFFATKKINIKCKNKNLYAFSGLGNNLNFYNSLKKENGYKILKFKEYKDHHPYKDLEIKSMISEAKKLNLQLVCTEKDYIKINKKFRGRIYPIKMEIKFLDEKKIYNKILQILANQ
jgi:tetraacyldisaccharide 4'-kinase